MKRSVNEQSRKVEVVKSFVCYADILGYSQLCQDAFNTNTSLELLDRLHRALSGVYHHIREHATDLMSANRLVYSVKVFTDNIVIGYPLCVFCSTFNEPELNDIFTVFSGLQMSLALEGFFLRGGIAFGDLYMDQDLVFGSAFMEAVNQDKKGGPPRITLAPSVEEIVIHQSRLKRHSPLESCYKPLLQDSDGVLFINYLELALDDSEGNIPVDLIERHRLCIANNLLRYKANTNIYGKYVWAAQYHNFVCQEFADRHPAFEEARILLQSKIDLPVDAPSPKRIDVQTLDDGLHLLSSPGLTEKLG